VHASLVSRIGAVKFKEISLERLDWDRGYTAGFPLLVVSAFRGRIQVIRAAPQKQAILQFTSLQIKRCGNGASQHSMRVTDEWQLIVAFEDGDDGRVAIVEALMEYPETNKERR
jgi:proteic killer suppression protein